jgi:hypothetical protein
MSAPTKTELWELAARIAQADSEDHEDDVVIQPMFDLLEKLSKRQQEILVDLLTPNGKKAFKKALKRCASVVYPMSSSKNWASRTLHLIRPTRPALSTTLS